MSSQESATPLHIRPYPSRVLAGFIILAHGGAIVLSLLSTPLWVGILLSVVIVCSLVYALNQHVLTHKDTAIAELIWDSYGSWTLVTRDGIKHNARLKKPVYLQARIVILNFVVDGRTRSIIFLPDTLDTNSFRKLRVRLQLESYQDAS